MLPISNDVEMAAVRRAVRECAVQIGMSLVEQTKLVTAASELARNALLHGGGRAEIALVESGGRRGIRLVCTDDGPGIADPAQAMSDGYSTGGGLGLGLGGTRRLVDEFTLDTAPGRGTTVTVVSWAWRAAGPR
ncbi:serine/threonine-protein kinase RsbT [Thermomonospora echinospora]|uniref:Serine/threonine-protein kinase RsbT n=2 Tax=Thermomonospora echinospora TaxID=1992 RepID=A0A1H5YJJ4_9ACTN|nr:serine/threonine-protein kinase RsbT [Thermomonospora echinospora]